MADLPRFSSDMLNDLSEANERYGFSENRINWKLLLGTFVFIGLSIPTIHLVHQWQMSKVQRAILERVESLKDAGKLKSAIEMLDKYLRYKPDDAEKRVDLVELYHKNATSPAEVNSLITLQYSTLGLCESSPKLQKRIPGLRRSLTDRLIQVGRYEDAIEQVHLGSSPELDVLLEKQLARSRMGLWILKRADVAGKYGKKADPDWLKQCDAMHPADLLARALIDIPGDLELTELFVEICFAQPGTLASSLLAGDSLADLRMRARKKTEEALLKSPKAPEAWLLHYRVKSLLDIEIDRQDIEQALVEFPEDPQVQKEASLYFLRLAQKESNSDGSKAHEASRNQDLERAAFLLSSLTSTSKSRDSILYLAMGEVLEQKGNVDDAIRVWTDGTRVCSAPTWDLHVHIAQRYLQNGEIALAREALQGMDEAIRRESIAFPVAVQAESQRKAQQQWIAYYLQVRDTAQVERLVDALRASNVTTSIDSQANTLVYLGAVYSNVGQWQNAAEVLADAVSLRPSDDETLRMAYQASIEAKLLPQARKQIDSIAEKKFMDWVQLASLSLELPTAVGATGESDVVKAEASLAKARELMASNPQDREREWMVDFIEYGLKLRQSSRETQKLLVEEASRKMVKLCEDNPEKLDMWQAHISALRKWGKTREAESLLAAFQENNPNNALAIVYRATKLAADGQNAEATRILLEKFKQSPESEPILLTLFQVVGTGDSLNELVDTCIEVYKEDVQRLLTTGQLACKIPSRWRPRGSGFSELAPAFMKEWNSAVQRIEDRVRAIEGDSGTEWRSLRARRLLTAMDPNQTTELPSVRDLSAYIIAKKPSSPIGYALQGMVLERMNELDPAIAMYLKAVGLGEQDVTIYERLTELLYAQGRFKDAQLVMNKLGRGLSRSAGMSSVALRLAASENDQDLLVLAEEGIELRPSDPMAWVWYAQVQELISRGASREDRNDALVNARQALDRASAIAPSDLRVLNAEYVFYSQFSDTVRLDETIERLKGAEDIDPIQKNIALGRMFVQQRKLMEALEYYQAAEELGAKRSGIAMLKAEAYCSQKKIDSALECLDDALNQEPQNGVLRRYYATILGSRGTVADWERIEPLLTASTFSNSVEDNRLLASLYIQRGLPSDLIKARRILERLVVAKSDKKDEDNFRLGLLCQRSAQLQFELKNTAEGNRLLDDAERYLQQALVSSPFREDYLNTYGRILLKRNRVQDAISQADLLLRLDPDAFTANLLMASAKKVSENSSAASGIMKAWLQRSREKTGQTKTESMEILSQAILGFLVIQDIPSVERAMLDLEAIDPRAALLTLKAITKNDEITTRSSAIDLLMQRGLRAGAESSLARDVATVLAESLIESPFNADMPSKLRSFMIDVQSAQSDDPRFIKLMADYWLVTGERSASVDAYRSLVKSGTKDPAVLNNLANLLSESPDGLNEAIQIIEQAISIAGELPDLLDSKGAILMRMGKLEEAAGMFERAAKIGTNPLFKFHWYIALMRAGRTDLALQLKDTIDKSALRRIQLSPDDVEALDKLQ